MVHLVLAAAVLIALIGRNKSKYILAVAFFVLFLFAALRYQYGNDYMSYYNMYLMIHGGVQWDLEDFLYFLLNKLCPSYYIVIALTSFLFIYTVYRMTVENVAADCAWISVLIFVISPYLFLMNLSAIRQCMATVMFIVAIPFAIKRQFWKYALLILLGMMFHKSAVILLPIYFFIDTKPVKPVHVALITVGVAFLLFVADLDYLVQQTAKVFNDANYSSYVQSGTGNSLRATLLTAVGWVYVVGNLPKLKGNDLVYGKLYLIGVTLGVLALQLSALTRVQMYFDIFGLVAIPSILRVNRGIVVTNPNNVLDSLWRCVNHYALPVLVFVIYALRYYSFFTNPSWSPFFEYQTIFSVL